MKRLREIALPGMFDVPTTVDMTPAAEPEAISTATFTGRVAAYFTARPNVWIDGREIAKVGGAYAWRSRVSDCRKAPYNLTIKNRVKKQYDIGTDKTFAVSEYRYVPLANEA